MKKLIMNFCILAACLYHASVGSAESYAGISIERAYAYATAHSQKDGAVFLTIVSKADDRLTGVSSPVSAGAELHHTVDSGGLVSMKKIDSHPVRPGEALQLSPSGLHIMLTGLHAPLTEGSSFPLTLSFEKAGMMETKVTVVAPGEAPEGDHSGHSHHHMP